MEVLSNPGDYRNMGSIKTESHSQVFMFGEDGESSRNTYSSSRLSGNYIPQYPTEEIIIKPEVTYGENSLNESYSNGYYGNTSSGYEEWSETDTNVKYEYQEPEENFISIDDVKAKPFLFEVMKSSKDEPDDKEKQNYENIVNIDLCEEDEDDDVVLIEDDDNDDEEDDEMPENEVGEELDWMDLEEQEKQIFECFLCNKKVASNYNLRRHMMIHTGERPFGCDICLRRFREFSDFKKHRKVHINEKGFTCMVCRQNVPSTKNATKCTSCDRKTWHTRTSYGDLTLDDIPCIEGSHKKAFVCPVCDRIFGSRHNLKRHYMIHTGEKPYKCDICEKHFREVSTLKKHMLTHSRIKLFKCFTCGREYSDFGAYNRHKMYHDHTFQQEGIQIYENGKKSDGEEYLFECGECYKKFSDVSLYKKHLKLHSNDYTFQCYICKRMFRSREKLNAHLVTHDYEDSN